MLQYGLLQLSPIDECEGIGNRTISCAYMLRRNKETETFVLAIAYFNRFVRGDKNGVRCCLILVCGEQMKNSAGYHITLSNILADAHSDSTIQKVYSGTVSAPSIF